MYKIIIAICSFALLTQSASANQNVSHSLWEIDQENHAFIKGENHSGTAQYLYEYGFVMFSDESEHCNPIKDTDRKGVMSVNGQAVEMLIACGESTEKMIFFPVNEAGRNFVNNEFRTKTVVNVGNYIFSANGFLSAIQKVAENNSKAI